MEKSFLRLRPERVDVTIGGHSKAACRRAAFHVQRRARANVKAAGRIDTGKMMNSIVAKERLQGGPLLPRYYVQAKVPYAIFQEMGTKGSRPVTAKVLRFKPKGGGKFVFAMKTGPVPPAHFMRDAFRSLKPSDFLPGGGG